MDPAIGVVAYKESDAAAWDKVVGAAPMGTILHTRRFLSYHQDRFVDLSLMLHRQQRLVGVMPAATERGHDESVISHPGATFGGIVHGGELTGASMLEALTQVREYLAARGVRRLSYAPVPSIYHRRPSADDLYALFRLHAVRVRCDLSCALDLSEGPRLSTRRRRGLNRARRAGIDVVEGPQHVEELWPVIEANLSGRHGAHPVHAAHEMRMLVDLFPGDIGVVVARHLGEAVAGVVLFDSARVSHAQYIASSAEGNMTGALDAVFAHCLTRARERGARYFDFGTSNREGGHVLNTGLYDFKAQFGGSGVAYEYYDLDVNPE